MTEIRNQIAEARDYIQARTSIQPEVAMVLGSGLGDLVSEIEVDAEFPYNEIPNFAVSTVEGHAGKLVLGILKGREVAVMQGRLHYYEGHPMSDVIFPIRVLHAAVKSGNVAHTGPLLPCLSNLDPEDDDAVLQATQQLLEIG